MTVWRSRLGSPPVTLTPILNPRDTRLIQTGRCPTQLCEYQGGLSSAPFLVSVSFFFIFYLPSSTYFPSVIIIILWHIPFYLACPRFWAQCVSQDVFAIRLCRRCVSQLSPLQCASTTTHYVIPRPLYSINGYNVFFVWRNFSGLVYDFFREHRGLSANFII